jgi:hypothetical protein
VRLLYLDEAGTSEDAKFLTVAGVLVHGDRQWPKVDAAILALIDSTSRHHTGLALCFMRRTSFMAVATGGPFSQRFGLRR